MKDPRIQAVREDKLIGRGTCSVADETMSNDELIEYLDSMGAKTPLAAIKEMREMEDAHMDKMLDTRWGEDSDREMAIYNEWKEREANNGISDS